MSTSSDRPARDPYPPTPADRDGDGIRNDREVVDRDRNGVRDDRELRDRDGDGVRDDREVRRDLPWLVRGASHALTTEGVAMLFGRLVRDGEWLAKVAELPQSDLDVLVPQLDDARRAALLTFARWVLVMTSFERRLYADPEQDLDTLWWDLVEEYQQLRRPDGRHAPDFDLD